MTFTKLAGFGLPTSLVALILLTCPPASMAEKLKSGTSYGDYSIVDPMIYQKQDSIAEAMAFIGEKWPKWAPPDEKLAGEKHLRIVKKMIYAWKFHKPELLRSIFSSKTEEMYKNKGNPEYLDSWADQMAEKYLFPVHDTDPKFYVTYIDFDPNSKRFTGLLKWAELPETPVGQLIIRKRGGNGRGFQYVIENDEIRISFEMEKTPPDTFADERKTETAPDISAKDQYEIYSAALKYVFGDTCPIIPIMNRTMGGRIGNGTDSMHENLARDIPVLQSTTIKSFLMFGYDSKNPADLYGIFAHDGQCTTVTEQYREELFPDENMNEPGNWKEFDKIFPKSPGLIYLSKIGLNKKMDQALLNIWSWDRHGHANEFYVALEKQSDGWICRGIAE